MVNTLQQQQAAGEAKTQCGNHYKLFSNQLFGARQIRVTCDNIACMQGTFSLQEQMVRRALSTRTRSNILASWELRGGVKWAMAIHPRGSCGTGPSWHSKTC